MPLTNISLFPPSRLSGWQAVRAASLLPASLLCIAMAGATEAPVQFNTDVLDVQDREHIDLSQFTRAGYIMPGTYTMTIQVNKGTLPERPVSFMAPDDDPKGSEACLTHDDVAQLGFKDSMTPKLTWWHDGQCLSTDAVKGMSLRGDLSSGVLYVSIPNSFLEYSGEDWDPPSRWDDGVPGVLLDYNMTMQTTRQQAGETRRSVSGNGVAGANLGPWRLRADWQAQDRNDADQSGAEHLKTTWNRYYLYRAIRSLRAKLSVGENYLSTGLFDSFRYTGVGLESDDSQLPPNLRGYAPEVVGVARTNARVTVSQQGRVIYESTVASGPFRIQDLNAAVSGKLDVRVQEQDGSVQTFSVNTSDIPYLTRPGSIRYRVAAGKPSDYRHNGNGPAFGAGEFSWGVNNGWSLYGGALTADRYHSLAVGVGRDLLALGAISLDATQSRAQLREGTKQGGSWRLSYSKRFDETDSQVTFAGYRFSTRNFMTMSQFLNAYQHTETAGVAAGSRQSWTLTFNQQFQSLGASAYLSYTYNNYWDGRADSAYSATLSRYMDIGRLKGVSLSLSATRSRVNGKDDNSLYLGLSVPWGESGQLNYGANTRGGNVSHSVGYYDRIDGNNTYRINAGTDQHGRVTGDGYLTHEGSLAEMTATAAWQGGNAGSLGMSLRGGMTATPYGVALHRTGSEGGTRMMVDTAGISGVPVRGGNGDTWSNAFGKAVVTNVGSYWRNSESLDLDKLGDDVEATRSVVEDTLTEGAIGYRKFTVIAGKKAMAVLKLPDGSSPPFGATVQNDTQAQTGIVSDDGSVWLSGMRPGEVMAVSWDGVEQCSVTLPSPLPVNSQTLLLPCKTVRGVGPAAPTGK